MVVKNHLCKLNEKVPELDQPSSISLLLGRECLIFPVLIFLMKRDNLETFESFQF
ncbi:hypothetical protein CLF_110350 [Clonorchis sinensis]|uniref:Uncharacterized protein n=1 Tax=Clonorchis sinensis TaxID=79923 RepID=G7YKK4_CLOSI|nr:hypothetical protein CLF_110350 [Clonorchis sinensis]